MRDRHRQRAAGGWPGSIDAKERCLIEYAEVGNLKRHYSTLRYGLSSFLVMVSLTAFANYFAQTNAIKFLALIRQLMLNAGLLSCLVLSYRCERQISTQAAFGAGWTERPRRSRLTLPISIQRNRDLREMCLDEMNWIMLIVFALITIVFWASTLNR